MTRPPRFRLRGLVPPGIRMHDPLISPAASDAGGIAARRGFRVQDHVAARLALEMLQAPGIEQLECETGDDIILRRTDKAMSVNEYIQVKTTEAEGKWNITELTTRDKSRKGSSVCEKSLLSDRFGGTAWFRFVTTRAISTKLAPFLRARANRNGFAAFDDLVAAFRKRYPDVKSGSGLGLGEWAERMLWEVEGEERSLLARNVNEMLRLAAGRGPTPAYHLMLDTYAALVSKVRAMGDASVAEPEKKIWSRGDCIIWWDERLKAMRELASSAVKVYQMARPTPFFSELARIDEVELKRALYAFDVEYDDEKWRRGELIEHLLDWLPEMALPASTLASFNHLTARRLPVAALKALERHGAVDMPQVVAALMLHAILRHHFDAEPIACRIFFRIAGGMRSTSAHIVQKPEGDEIWLGRSKLITAETHREVVDEVLGELRTALNRDVLVEERDIIVQLREPHHLRADCLGPVLDSMAKTSDLLRVLRLPVLIAYDSATLSPGFAPGYVERLRKEVDVEYARIKTQLGHELDRVEVAMFLVPVECADTLAIEFEKRLRRA
ncbi:dsDNA nuclease domain-containing protein [Novosphingobium flavum]|uniref:dsDNA nuclease domain-containing protein n=1 Tax=Novosphingobium flavum TaxID=1778672 RepID=UPI0031B59A58